MIRGDQVKRCLEGIARALTGSRFRYGRTRTVRLEAIKASGARASAQHEKRVLVLTPAERSLSAAATSNQPDDVTLISIAHSPCVGRALGFSQTPSRSSL